MTMQPQLNTRAHVDQVTVPDGSPVAVLRFTGDIASTSRDVVFGAYSEVPVDTRKVVFDFSKMEYMNSSGIALIIELLMAASKSDRSVQSFGLSPHFQKVFTMVGLNRYTRLHPDEASACAAFAD
ncbi:MAG: STAS domain-containing protein [Acidobacteriaceae bacterium]